eukprot:TRINITY_DN41524_c0_g2_i1.p2 TRINITY_DN41524_c0_g2~~TRINITY_DN41524_c0_g2_i1.p2  ORF type:complete len:110 (+),score=23.77 TRINITY_DN41524_c0_g2_i1:46-375(+)
MHRASRPGTGPSSRLGETATPSFFFQAEDGIRDAQESRGLGDVYKRQGGVEVYKGHHYGGEQERTNLVLIRYIPGHYQALLPIQNEGPSLEECLVIWDQFGVKYVVTEG